MEVALDDGRTRPGWLIFDLADRTFPHEAVNRTTNAQVEEFIEDASG
jgi:predicted glycoside hydrolase/deacetylase ChbG (UPF0249 family)